MPRVWLRIDPTRWAIDVLETDIGDEDSYPVDMNASLLRQIKAANKQYDKFQNVLHKFLSEAMLHPETVRRVR